MVRDTQRVLSEIPPLLVPFGSAETSDTLHSSMTAIDTLPLNVAKGIGCIQVAFGIFAVAKPQPCMSDEPYTKDGQL